MKPLDLLELFILGSLWGCSFLFMRIAAPEFGAAPLMAVRVMTAALFLLPVLVHSGKPRKLLERWQDIGVIGAINSALPFFLFAFATLYLTAGFTAVINATAPLFTAVVAFIWVGERLSRVGLVGLLVGLVGVVALVWDKLGFGGDGVIIAILAGLLGAFSYGIAANFTRIRLSGVGSLELATGSQLAASLLLLPFCIAYWPAEAPSLGAWLAVLALGIPCTGIAYILFFRLLARLGPARAVTVTYLVPLAAMVTGAIFLDEVVTPGMMLGCGLILFGTGLATGVIRFGAAR